MRTDIHTPSQIIPSNYQEVGVWTMNIQGVGDCQFILQERKRIKEHMDRTGGTYAHVDTTGSCQVCGNVQAIYLVLFYHELSNTYIRVGMDCTVKLGLSGDTKAHNLFRRNLQNAREAQAGKRKAIAILGDLGLSEAWDIFTATYPQHTQDCKSAGTHANGDDNGVYFACTCDFESRARQFNQFPERTITDITGKLVSYGNISDKQAEFVRSLLKQIADRPIVEAQRKAEADAAGPVPTGRVTVTGTVLSVKQVERNAYYRGDDGVDTKVLIKLENGSKVYGNRFANVEKGDTVTFVASINASDKDPKFGFFKRAQIAKTQEEIDATKAAKKQAIADAKFFKTVAYA